ncbi:MAG: selenocysteine-specific translation elongation factor [Tissierellia bacterium]|nr:selenocysteine-specific translation elongation factor [Tissierellia bacterium]
MKHFIIGTAGHIDHGKTTLIRALTGRNTDRLKEEQNRGISIELGFTYFDLPSGKRAGIIDVPGHEKFIKNMLAGVIGIDIVLLVVAADEGIMPQTAEHLAILDLLGINKGIIVITKTDLVEDEWIELIEEDIYEEVESTFLEGSPIVRVSSTHKSGIDELIKLIDEFSDIIEERDTKDMPRLPVDRAFSISGFGTVVTGTLLSGRLNLGDEVQIFPGNTTSRIRSLQVHDEDAEVAYGGQRVAINLAGVKRKEVERGSIIAPINSMKSSMMVDVKVKVLKSADRSIENRTRLHLYIGTREVLCRIVLLDKDQVNPGEEAYAQLRLEEEIVSKRGDKFILRFYSPMFTIGGGEILEANAIKKKRFDEKAIGELKIKESGDSKDILEKIIYSKSKDFLSIKELSQDTSMLEETILSDIDELIKEDKIITFTSAKDIYTIHYKYFDVLHEKIINEIKSYHKKYPLRIGMPKEEIRSKILGKAKQKIADQILEKIFAIGNVVQVKEFVSLSDFKIKYSKEQIIIKDFILDKLKVNEFLPPRNGDIASELKLNLDQVEEVLNSLINEGVVIRINEDVYILSSSYYKALELLKEFVNINGSISLGEFRDILGTNRKVALGLLEYYDQMKITNRDGEKRTLIK